MTEQTAPLHSENLSRFSRVKSFLLRYGWWLFPILTLLLLLNYLFGAARVEFHSDCTDTLLWAMTARESGKWIDPDFSYACVLPFGGQLLMQIFLPIFGVSMAAHRGGMLLFLLLFASSIAWMLWEMGWRLPVAGCATSALLLLLTASEKLREIFFGHIIYYSLGIFLLAVSLALTFRLLRRMQMPDYRKRNGFWIPAILLFLWLLLSAINGLQAIVLCIFPVLAAVIGRRLLSCEPFGRARDLPRILTVLGMLLALMIGLLVRSILMGNLVAGYADAYSTFSAPKEWASNLLKLPEHWFTLLGVSEEGWIAFQSTEGVLQLLQITAGGILFLLPWIALGFYRHFSKAEQMLLLANTALTAAVLFAFVFGNLSAANWRLSPIICTAMLSSLLLLKFLWNHRPKRRFAVLLTLPLALFCLCNGVRTARLPDDPALAPLYEIETQLQARGLTYGYATFWNASAITVETDSVVTVRPVEVSREQAVFPYRYQSAARWYQDQPSTERYFLLLTEEEYHTYKWSFFADTFHPTESAEIAGFVLLIYHGNPISAAAEYYQR